MRTKRDKDPILEEQKKREEAEKRKKTEEKELKRREEEQLREAERKKKEEAAAALEAAKCKVNADKCKEMFSNSNVILICPVPVKSFWFCANNACNHQSCIKSLCD